MDNWEVAWDGEDGATCGVHREGTRLVWWYSPAGPGGHLAEMARIQTVEEFLVDGPPVTAPDGVEGAVRRRLRAEGLG
jgi:hypothetical protein